MAGTQAYVVDEQGRRYELGRPLGSGGQGTVYAVAGHPLAVKLCRPSSADRDRVDERVRAVRRLDLSGVPIARSVALLRPPHLGYVMELMDDMQPLAALIPGTGCPATREGFLAAGGLGRRLRLLGRYAAALARLHGKGLVYGDPSATNVLVSTSSRHDEVQLIDPDNLRYWSEPGSLYIHTPGFGAPELVARRSGVNTLTDAHAFAVTAFQVLRGVHPFLGDEVMDGEPELEEQALAGELPWVDDPADRSNATVRGLPRDVVLSAKLRDLAARAFGVGRTAPELRPGVAEWAERLHAAADATVECPACGSSFYFNRAACPWCDEAAPALVLAHFHAFDPEEGLGSRRDTRLAVRALCRDVPVHVEGRDLGTWAAADAYEPRLELFWDGRRLKVRSKDGGRYRAVAADGSAERELGHSELAFEVGPRTERWRIHLGPPDRVHRVLSFELKEPRR